MRSSFVIILFHACCVIFVSALPPAGSYPPASLTAEDFAKEDEVVVYLWKGGGWAGFTQDVWRTPNYLGHEVRKKPCEVKCTLTADVRVMPYADTIFIEAAHFGANYEWRRSPPGFIEKRPHQLWTHLAYEQPYYFPFITEEDFYKRIDVNMTYNQKDHVPITFLCSWGGGTIDDYLLPPKWPKKNFIAFLNSNCGGGGAYGRTEYVRELMQYVPVDALGPCLHNKDLPPEFADHPFFGPQQFGGSMRNKQIIFSDYKFVLAFENNNVTDYVTEKIFNVYRAGAVPVYMGAPNIDEWTPGEHSLIKVTDFKNPRELADFLLYLNASDEEYLRYFDWKKQGLSERFRIRYDRCVFYGSECRLCKYVASVRKNYPPELRQYRERQKLITKDTYALRFNGQDDYMTVPSHPRLRFNSDFTLMMWAKAERYADLRIVDKNEAGKINGFQFDVLTTPEGRGNLRVGVCGELFLGYRPLFPKQYYHFTVVLSTELGKVKMYVNGKLDAEFNCVDPTPENDLPILIGKANKGASYWDGEMDDIMFWDRVLSEDEIFRYMFERPFGNEDGLVLWYPFIRPAEGKIIDGGPLHLDATFSRNQPQYVDGTHKPMYTTRCG